MASARPIVLNCSSTSGGIHEEIGFSFRTKIPAPASFGTPGFVTVDIDPSYVDNYEYMDPSDCCVIRECRGGLVLAGTFTSSTDGRQHPCVLKVLNSTVVQHQQNPQRLNQEIRGEFSANQRIRQHRQGWGDHAGVNNVVCNWFETQDPDCHNIIFVMERCSGGELYDYINARAQANNPLSEAELMCVFSDLVNGVQFLHSAGIAHLDLSVENFMLVDAPPAMIDRGRPFPFIVKIIDYGQSKIVNGSPVQLPRGVRSCGKVPAMAPEVYGIWQSTLDGSSACINGFKADYWSVACVLYTVAFFRHPYNVPTLGDEGFDAVTQGLFPSRELPQAFIQSLTSMFHDDPEIRHLPSVRAP